MHLLGQTQGKSKETPTLPLSSSSLFPSGADSYLASAFSRTFRKRIKANHAKRAKREVFLNRLVRNERD
jgi:siroheme synthase (precorrin-2 oxidase/ferrochelatase)